MQVGGMRLALVLDPNERRRIPCQLESVGYDQGDRLGAELDLVVLERTKRRAGRCDFVAVVSVELREARAVLVREDLQHARQSSASAASMQVIFPLAIALETTQP